MAQRTDSQERYLELVEGEGLLRTLFQTVKYALEGTGVGTGLYHRRLAGGGA